MKRTMIAIVSLFACLTIGVTVWAGPFETHYDYENGDGTYSYYFTGEDFPQGLYVTMDQEWYQNTFVIEDDNSASFYHKDSYNAYADEGLEGGGFLFSIGASVNTDFQDLPQFEYIGFDEESCLNFFAELPSDYPAYMGDEDIRAEYDALSAGTKDVIGSIRIGKALTESDAQTSTGIDALKKLLSTMVDSEPDIPEPVILSSGDYSYYINADGTITITDCAEVEETLEIPSEIDGYSVTAIGTQAFSYYNMQHLSLPDSIKTIGYRAFEYCEELLDVTIPAGTTVESCAFGYNDKLKQVLIGDSAVIKSRAFGYCDHLETVVCANGSKLEADTFEYCDNLEKVILCGDVEVEDDAFYSCDKMRMILAEESEFENWKQSEPIEGSSGRIALAGGWEITEDPSVTEEAREVFEKAMSEQDGAPYKPVALLATQVVAGINYCFLTAAEDSYGQPGYQIVYIWQDPAGNARLLEAQEIEFGLSGMETLDE